MLGPRIRKERKCPPRFVLRSKPWSQNLSRKPKPRAYLALRDVRAAYQKGHANVLLVREQLVGVHVVVADVETWGFRF